jgi:uncharacterized membrane protein YuzA (DUF378 family)
MERSRCNCIELKYPSHIGVIMKSLNLITLILTIVGGLNWGLVGLAEFDLVAAVFGSGSDASRLIYALVGLSALYQILPLFRAFQIDEPRAEAAAPRM